jgi:peptide/nickel transport system substrate-binding protein
MASVSVLSVGCSVANSTSGDAASPDTLRIVLPQEPPTLEPCDSSLTSTGIVVRSNITEPLTERNAVSGELEPKLAESWVQTSPNKWTFAIRSGVTFSDGSPFDATDAAVSIDRAVNSDIGCDVDGYVFGDDPLVVTAVDPSTLTVETVSPDPILPLRISFVEMVPRTTSTTDRVREPIGTGPYKIDKWDYSQRLTLTRNDSYWGAAPEYSRAIYQWRTEGSVRAAMVVNDEAEIAVGLGPEDGAGDLGVAYPNGETTALRMQATEPPLDDYRVREAIDLAVNRAGIVKALFRGLGEPAAQLAGSSIVGFDPDLQPTPYDPDRAAKLVADARADGVPVDNEIRLIGRTGQYPKINETIEVIQNALSKAGLNVKIQMMDTAAQLEYQIRPFPSNTGPYLLMIMHGNQAGDAQFTDEQYLRSDGYQSSYGTAEFDAKLDAANALTGADREAAFQRIFDAEPVDIRQYAYIAHMSGVLGMSPTVQYSPNSASGDEMRLAEFTRTDPSTSG